MMGIHRVKSRLQFMLDMCQSLYSPKGKQGTHSRSLESGFETWNGRTAVGAHGAIR
jgi:hypothetical protein